MIHTRLEGAKFALFDNCGNHIATGCTNRAGEIDFTGLPLGRYVVQQLDSYGEFECNQQCIEVELDGCDRCQTVAFENVQHVGGIRVQLSGRTESCNFDNSSTCLPNSNCSTSNRCGCRRCR